MNAKKKWFLARAAVVVSAITTLNVWADNSGSASTGAASANTANPTPPATAGAAATFLEDPLAQWVAKLTKALPPLEGLDINPQMVSATDGKGATFGLGYKYDRDLVAFPNSLAGDLSLKVHSDGIYLADAKSIPNNVFTHSLTLNWIDILPPTFTVTNNQAKHLLRVQADRLGHMHDQWQEEADPAKKDAIFYEAAKELRGTAKLEVKNGDWYATGTNGKPVDVEGYVQQLQGIVPRAVFLSADLDAKIEHDQSLNNMQYAGEALLRSKIIYPVFDLPASVIRKALGSNKDGNGAILDWHNLAGGPYLWGGIGMVDATQNKARKAITSDHDVFPRANVGVYYRTELYAFSETQSVALELNWSFYYELDAPGAIRTQHLDLTSYFKATLLLPVIKSGNAFVEYSAGQLPVDLIDGQTVSVGWRYSF